MTGLFLALALTGLDDLQAEPWDLMETGSIWFWTSGAVQGGRGAILFDGEPAVLIGDPGLPPWGSFTGLQQHNPLEGGLWSAGEWSLDFRLPQIPDSSYESEVGLLENTSGRNRYMGYLLRPLPASLLFDLSVGREDTLSSQRIRLATGDHDFAARFRQGDGDRYMLTTGWAGPGTLRLRGGFSRMYEGCSQVDLFGSVSYGSGQLTLSAGAGGAWLRDSVIHGEVHVLSRYRTGILGFVCRADVTDDDGEFDFGGAGGCSADLGPVQLQGGVYAAPGDDPSLLFQADAGPATGRIVVSDEGSAAGADLDFSVDGFLLRGSATAWESDSVRVAGLVLPSIRYWNARISAGARCDLLWSAGNGWRGTVDVLSTFTLGRFAFVFSVENIDDDYRRNWTYGLTWEFTDKPPVIPTEEESRGGGEA